MYLIFWVDAVVFLMRGTGVVPASALYISLGIYFDVQLSYMLLGFHVFESVVLSRLIHLNLLSPRGLEQMCKQALSSRIFSLVTGPLRCSAWWLNVQVALRLGPKSMPGYDVH